METIISSFVASFTVLFLVSKILFFIALYLLFSLAIHSIAVREKSEHVILAFIPIANIYLLGKIIGPFSIFNIDFENVEIILPLAVILFYALNGNYIIGTFLGAICMVFIVYALHIYYKRVVPENAFIYALISAILPTIGIPIIFFIIKDK